MIALFDGEYAFLSNFYPSPFTHDGIMYPTNEHFFQAMKTLDIKQRQAIANASTPGQAKRMGRQVNLRPDWETSKEHVMELGLKLKFQNPVLAEKLKATTGNFEPVYTHREDGRRLILKCRKRSYITFNEKAMGKKYKVSHWN